MYPEFKHVFVGDNGQGDVRAAEMMAERFPGLVEAVYVHRVRRRETLPHVSGICEAGVAACGDGEQKPGTTPASCEPKATCG